MKNEKTPSFPIDENDEMRAENPIAEFTQAQQNLATRRAYAADLRDFFRGEPTLIELSTFLELPLSELTKRLSDYEVHLRARRLKETTVNRRLATLKVFLAWAQIALPRQIVALREVGNTLSTENRAKTPKAKIGGNVFNTLALTDEMAERLLLIPDATTPRGKRDKAILILLSQKGLQRAELCALDVEDFQGEERTLHVPIKGHRVRREAMFLDDATLGSLQLHVTEEPARSPSTSPSTPLFRNATRGLGAEDRLTIDGVYHLIRFYGNALRVSNLTSRRLRHGAILRTLAAVGGDGEKAHQILPHISLDTLLRYRNSEVSK